MKAFEYLILWFGLMIFGLFATIAISMKVGQAYGPQADMTAGLVSLVFFWGLAFWCLHKSFTVD